MYAYKLCKGYINMYMCIKKNDDDDDDDTSKQTGERNKRKNY